MSKLIKTVFIYTDGACSGNPGPGGYGSILKYKNKQKEISGGFRHTTNNRMELMALIEALNLIKESCNLNIYSDSKYLINPFEKKWLHKWEKQNWISNKKLVKNTDLWINLLNLTKNHNDINFFRVKGHSNHEENEICDQLAVAASKQPTMIDTTYEKENPFK